MNGRALLFANLRAGRARAFSDAVEALRGAGIEVEAHFDLGRQGIARAVSYGSADFVIAFGGDGTIGSVVNGVAGSDLTLGIIAAGTSNNFARSLGIRPGIASSVQNIVSAPSIEVDLGEVNGQYFAHAAIMGLNVAFAHKAQRYRKLMGRISYPVASLLVYRSRHKLSLVVTQNGESRHLETYQLAILNSSIFGGGLELRASETHAQDGKLRVVSVDDMRLRAVIEDLPHIFFERHLGLPGGTEFDLTDAEITSPEALDITLDGEIKTQTPAHVRIVPRGLKVLAHPRRLPG